MKQIDPDDLDQMLAAGGELALIDVREQGVFGLGHLLLAACVPLSHLELRFADLVPRRDTPIVLVDSGDGDTVAATAAQRLDAWGYRDIAILADGMAGWRAAGREVYSGVNVPSKAFGEFVEHTYETPRLTAAELQARRERGEAIVVLDSRPFDEYHRMSIPGGVDAPGAELVYRAFDMAPDPATTVVVNCAGRTRSIIGAQSLINAGLPNPVVALENGTMGWHLAGLQVAHGATEVAPPPSAAGLDKARAAAQRVAARFGVRTVAHETLEQWRRGDDGRSLFLLDVRAPEEYAAGHLEGSRSAPGGQLVQATDEYVGVRNARIVLIDDTEVRATMTASWLNQMGWRDVFVLAGGLGDQGLTDAPHRPHVFGEPWPDTIAPQALADLLDTGAAAVIDLDTSLAYRKRHIPGAWWAVRSRLADQIGGVPATPVVAVTSADGALAALAARDVAALRGDGRVVALAGGTDAWAAHDLPLDDGLTNPLGPNDDVQYKAYDNAGGVEAAMREYLRWELGLVEQLARDGSLTFERYD